MVKKFVKNFDIESWDENWMRESMKSVYPFSRMIIYASGWNWNLRFFGISIDSVEQFYFCSKKPQQFKFWNVIILFIIN